VQLDPAGTVPPSVQVPPAAGEKSPASVPLSAQLVVIRSAVPIFITVTAWGPLVVPAR